MKSLKEELIDESYKSIKKFTKNNKLSDVDLKELDEYVKSIELIINNIQVKDDNVKKNIGQLFEQLIKNGT